MIECLTSSVIYNATKDAWVAGRDRKANSEKQLESRTKWKQPFNDYLQGCLAKDLRLDIVIRDVKRMDFYAQTNDEKGIFSWFRLGLIGQYHKDVMFGLRTSSLIFEGSERKWRKADWKTEKATVIAYLVGYVRYEDTASVDWEGDEYYSFPRIFCHFRRGGEPYERLAYCEKRDLGNGRFYFAELENEKDVQQTSLKFGTEKHR